MTYPALVFALLLALVWGVLWAGFLQLTTVGAWMASRRTWLTVVIGVGVDVLLFALVLDLKSWLMTLAIMGASSVGIIARSLHNEARSERTLAERLAGDD
jgi:hypothetical protein